MSERTDSDQAQTGTGGARSATSDVAPTNVHREVTQAEITGATTTSDPREAGAAGANRSGSGGSGGSGDPAEEGSGDQSLDELLAGQPADHDR